MDKSYESLGSNDKDQPHYNFESDGEPPTDQVGDRLVIIKRQQVTKTILEVGEKNNIGKPGKPYIVTVSLLGYFAENKEEIPSVSDSEKVFDKTKEVTEKHIRVPAD